MIDKHDPRLTAYVLGELNPEDKSLIEAAIAESPELESVVNELKATVDILQTGYQSQDSAALSVTQREALRNEVLNGDVARPAINKSSSRSETRRWMLAALAASLLGLLVGGAWWFANDNNNDARVAQGLEATVAVIEADSDANAVPEESVASDELKVMTGDRTIDTWEDTGKASGQPPLKPFPQSLSLTVDAPENDDRKGDEFADTSSFQTGDSFDSSADRFGFDDGGRGAGRGFGPRGGGGLGGGSQDGEFDVQDSLGYTTGDALRSAMPRRPTSDRGSRSRNQAGESSRAEFLSGGEGFRSTLGRQLQDTWRDTGLALDGSSDDDAKVTGTGLFDRLDDGLERVNQKTRSTSGKFGESTVRVPLNGRRAPGKDGKLLPAKKRSWKRVKATPNTTRLMVGDHEELELNGMRVNVQVDGFRARVLIDCLYYNDRDQQLEGNFKLRLPDDASPWYFAFGQSVYDFSPTAPADRMVKNEFGDNKTQLVSFQPEGIRRQRREDWTNIKEARMVPRERAAFAYEQTIRRKVDPALVEWSGAGIFNARVFPLAPHKMHRIVFGYDVNLTRTDQGYVYELALPEKTGHCVVDVKVNRVDKLKPALNTAPSPDADPDFQKTSFEQYRWTNPKAKTVRVDVPTDADLLLQHSDKQEGGFWGVQLTPELPTESVAGNERAIFLLDTSLSSNPDKFNVWLQLLKATLDNNRDSLKEFNVLFFDVGSSFWRIGYANNTQSNVDALIADCEKLSLEGATDLYGAVERIADAKWVSDKKDGPDLFLLSDGAATWGESDIRLIQGKIEDGNLGSVFAYQSGLAGTAIANLRFLANESGGTVFSVATEAEITAASIAHRKRPWRLDSIDADGATDIMTAGRIEWVYPGQTITMVGRGKPAGGVRLRLSQGTETQVVSVTPSRIESESAGRLYGQVAVGQLESIGDKVFDVSAAYARHFRVTGQTCSLLMLETEQDYQRFGIKPEEDLFVVKTKNAGEIVSESLAEFAETLADPKERLLGWITRLETMPGMSFKTPTALKLALDQINVVAISKPLDVDPCDSVDSPESYLQQLKLEDPDYEIISAESQRRSTKSIDQGLKVLSNLIERHPGDLVIARDVAFSAMQLDRPAQAYPLLMKVVKARPFECSVYPAIAQCLAQLDQADMAIVFYEVALEANFNNQGPDFKKIVAADYLHLLNQVEAVKLKSSVADFVKARRQTLVQTLGFEQADVLITMAWNTDQTDVDLHIGEPGGTECSYKNKKTQIGGQITSDVTTGFGPEMYRLLDAPKGKYDVRVKLFANNQSRASLRNRVHLKIYRNFGSKQAQVTHKSIQLKTVAEPEHVATVGVE